MVKVLKFGGSSLKNAKDFKNVAKIIKKEEDRPIVILSGVCGVTDTIQKYLTYKKLDEIAIQGLIQHLRRLHFKISSGAITGESPPTKRNAICKSCRQSTFPVLPSYWKGKSSRRTTRWSRIHATSPRRAGWSGNATLSD